MEDRASHQEAHEVHNPTTALVFTKVEHWITIGIGAILIAATLLLLTGSVAQLLKEAAHWPETSSLFLVVDQLLFTLMLVEILHTVRQSIVRDQIAVEPFLIVGIIASVRRILIVTVEVADKSKMNDIQHFNHSMIELGVLGGLTLVLIISIFMSRYSRAIVSKAE